MTNEQLIEKLKEAASNLSYYNAAEGPSYYQETEARGKAKAKFAEVVRECKDAGIDTNEILRGYLV